MQRPYSLFTFSWPPAVLPTGAGQHIYLVIPQLTGTQGTSSFCYWSNARVTVSISGGLDDLEYLRTAFVLCGSNLRVSENSIVLYGSNLRVCLFLVLTHNARLISRVMRRTHVSKGNIKIRPLSSYLLHLTFVDTKRKNPQWADFDTETRGL